MPVLPPEPDKSAMPSPFEHGPPARMSAIRPYLDRIFGQDNAVRAADRGECLVAAGKTRRVRLRGADTVEGLASLDDDEPQAAARTKRPGSRNPSTWAQITSMPGSAVKYSMRSQISRSH